MDHDVVHCTYAANVDNELILRNLLLAGCEVDVTATDGTTPLQVAARNNRFLHAEILLENNANPNILDERRENALLAAVRCGSVDCVKVLVSSSNIDTHAVNKNGQSALHLCATLSSDKLPPRRSPVEICELLLKREANRLSEKEFAAYRCYWHIWPEMVTSVAVYFDTVQRWVPEMLMVRPCFKLYETPHKDCFLSPIHWNENHDGPMVTCATVVLVFQITVRKHHCRHCGRLVCAKCSEVTMPIAKYGEEKKVRVCSLCAEVLTTGAAR
ncbi:FYVE zinc finger [Ostertagia ostertagi]